MTGPVLGTIGLIAAYVVIALLLLGLNIHSRWHWTVKTGAIVISSIFYVVTYLSLPPLLGWPIDEQPPRHFQLIASRVEQPDKQRRTQGAVYLWLTEGPGVVNPAIGPPRAYVLPYSSALHEIVLNANRKLHRGMPQIGEFHERPDGNKAQVRDTARQGQKVVPITFYDLPDPLFPVEK